MPKTGSIPTVTRCVVSAAATASLTLLAACGSSSSSTAESTSPSSPSQSTSAVTCTYSDSPQGKTGNASKPPASPDVSGQVSVTISTSIGDLHARLDADKAPCTVNSFVSLAKQGFFDKSPCHRLTTPPSQIFVLQCGDPTGTGTGGPGYTVPDELSGQETYGTGTMAMANSGANTGGSQFFMVYKKPAFALPASYTVFGHLDAASVKTLQKMASHGSDDATAPGDGHPKEAVTIQSMTVG